MSFQTEARHLSATAAAVALATSLLIGCDSAYTACARLASEVGEAHAVVGAYQTTVAKVRELQPMVSPARWAGLSADEPAILCYIEGFVPKAPPGREPHDLRMMAIARGQAELIMSGYSERIELSPP